MSFIKLNLDILASDLSDSEKLLFSLIKSRLDISKFKDEEMGQKYTIFTQVEMAQFLQWELKKVVRIFASLKSKNLINVKRNSYGKNIIFSGDGLLKNGNTKNGNTKNGNTKNENLDYSNLGGGTTQNWDVYTLIEYKKNTEKNTAREKKAKKQFLNADFYPAFISADVWKDFCAYKKERNENFTETGLKQFYKKLENFNARGFDVNAILQETMSNGWRGVFEPKTSAKNQGAKENTLENIRAKNKAHLAEVNARIEKVAQEHGLDPEMLKNYDPALDKKQDDWGF